MQSYISFQFNGTMKSGKDRVDYLLDEQLFALAVRFQMLDYNDHSMKCARVEVRGCYAAGRILLYTLYSCSGYYFKHFYRFDHLR